jgi:hypothetical protein
MSLAKLLISFQFPHMQNGAYNIPYIGELMEMKWELQDIYKGVNSTNESNYCNHYYFPIFIILKIYNHDRFSSLK